MKLKKAIIAALDIIIAVYLAMAVTAFNKPDTDNTTCSDVCIDIASDVVEGFLTPAEVMKMLSRDNLNPVGRPMSLIDTRLIEETLQAKELVEDAQCYTTQQNTVCIDIRQRIPVMRIMADSGDSYYIDNHGKPMPRTGYNSNLIVATGHINRNYAERVLAPMANIILNDQFWKSQIVQLNVLADGSVELVPRVGDHIAYLGQPTGTVRKLERLRKFYKYGLCHAGWTRYSRISVEFDNQIICKRRNS